MAELNLDGVGVALVTPFQQDFSIDYQALDKLIHHIIRGGCDYIVALGTTAESPTLTKSEKSDLAGFIRKKVDGRVPLVIGIGGNNTYGVVEDIKSMDLEGYTAILSVTPYYNKPTQEGLFKHYKTICENSPLPILLYNVPGRTGVNLSAETTIRLANFSDKFCGVKEASGKLDQCADIIKNTPHNFSVVAGDDALISKMMKIGSTGVISVLANVYPEVIKNIVTLCKSHNYIEADYYQKELSQLIIHLFRDGNPSGVKALLAKMGFVKNVLRLPLVPVSAEVENKLEEESVRLFNTN